MLATISDAIREYTYGTAHPNKDKCACNGGGWICSPYDTWEKCPAHYTWHPHPEDRDDDSERCAEYYGLDDIFAHFYEPHRWTQEDYLENVAYRESLEAKHQQAQDTDDIPF